VTFRLLGLPEELRLAIEEAGGDKTEEARLVYEASVNEAGEQVRETVAESLREVQEVVGPHGSISRLQAGGIRIAPGQGIRVFADGVTKTNITNNGTLVIGSDITQPATTTEIFFVEDEIYNGEQFDAGDFLVGDNSTGAQNMKYDASSGELQFRSGQTKTIYLDTDGSLRVGDGTILGIDANGMSFGVGGAGGRIDFSSSNINLYNYVAGKAVKLFITTTDAGTPAITWREAVGIANAAHFDISLGTDGSLFTLGGAVEIWGHKDGKETVFNQDSYDVDFRVEGATNANLLTLDAGLDAVGIGGAAESGKVLKVTGDVNIRHKLPFGIYTQISPMTADNSLPFAASIDRTITFVRWSQAWYVATTNDGSNYWTITLQDQTGSTTIKSFSTSAGAADTWTLNQATTFDSASAGISDIMLFVLCTKTGSPGALYLAGPNLEVTG